MDTRMADIDAQLDRLAAARRYLGHLKQCHHGPSLEDCPEFRAGIRVPEPAKH
ncbi:hypothetical protein [Nonomuraea sp. NPDC050540]|uniref:hypothetical protein n=1 Tax=Nonomuraea sp. NPDC050540 TaxID=3364367 RepID=UPI0037A0AF39